MAKLLLLDPFLTLLPVPVLETYSQTRSHHRGGQGDVDLEAKLIEWENFYNFNRPHGAFNGKTPYEALRERL